MNEIISNSSLEILQKVKRIFFFIPAAYVLYGLFFLEWNVSSLIVFFSVELLLIGIAGFLHVLLGYNRQLNTARNIRNKVGQLSIFLPVYAGLTVLVYTNNYVSMKPSVIRAEYPGMTYGLVLLAVFYVLVFLNDYLHSESYSKGNGLFTIVKTMIYALPVALMIMLIILPLVEYASTPAKMKLFGILIVLSRGLIEGLGSVNKRIFGNVMDEEHTSPIGESQQEPFQFE